MGQEGRLEPQEGRLEPQQRSRWHGGPNATGEKARAPAEIPLSWRSQCHRREGSSPSRDPAVMEVPMPQEVRLEPQQRSRFTKLRFCSGEMYQVNAPTSSRRWKFPTTQPNKDGQPSPPDLGHCLGSCGPQLLEPRGPARHCSRPLRRGRARRPAVVVFLLRSRIPTPLCLRVSLRRRRTFWWVLWHFYMPS
jgi:hypothetical protein